MKLTAQKYAQALSQVLAEKDVDSKAVAKHVVDILRRRRQTKLLPSILDKVEAEWCAQQGITRMDVEFAPKFKDALDVLEKAFKGQKTLVHSTPNDELIGGYRIKIEDTLIDASLKGRITALSQKLRT